MGRRLLGSRDRNGRTGETPLTDLKRKFFFVFFCGTYSPNKNTVRSQRGGGGGGGHGDHKENSRFFGWRFKNPVRVYFLVVIRKIGVFFGRSLEPFVLSTAMTVPTQFLLSRRRTHELGCVDFDSAILRFLLATAITLYYYAVVIPRGWLTADKHTQPRTVIMLAACPILTPLWVLFVCA